ncbi:thioesterase domain-containing protein [Streptomyces sp. W16]|uniref:thioesterase II family protein n=1 Tax=Streptomyces sp. W16 TaxID=3076631 RepID=UPI00295AD947|nr:thioesterase domain-containing protein [Streptomyces sp. W16]MDV9169313.1 thioesterase domain-containing protein [Streptomyces sp. W16]
MTGFSRWLLRRPSDDATARIFCFPYSGVGASMFNRWPRWIGSVEVCPLQLPARENRVREPHFGTYEALAENLVEPLLPYLDRPFVLFGHCAGALPAFETAALLAERGLPLPLELVVSAQVAPHHCPQNRFLDMDDEQLGEELARVIVEGGGEPHPLLIELTLEVLHQDLDANRVYNRERPSLLPAGITALHWADDTEIAPEQLLGWKEYAADVGFPVLDGGHYAFLSAPEQLMELFASIFAERAKTGPALRRTGHPGGHG